MLQNCLKSNPFQLFQEWYAAAEQSEMNDPNAMSLATIGPDLMPSVRIVLLKSFSEAGFIFYTNGTSQKGQELKHNPKAALCFHWKSLKRQIRVEGEVRQIPEATATEYFHSRPRLSQIGTWASLQSQILDHRETFEGRIEQFSKLYENQEIPKPPHWHGYCVIPRKIEFWAEMENRLHERLVFLLSQKKSIDKKEWEWTSHFLYP